MASSPRITAVVANAMLEAGIGSTSNNGKLRLYDGTQPISGGGAVTTQTMLAQFNMAADAFAAANGGILTANAIAATTGVAHGNATWYRLTKADGTTTLIDGSVGLEADDPDLILDDVEINIGEAIAVTAFLITQPLT